MSITLKQIAADVGVSQPLVTYALNNKPGVSEATRLKILAAAERLGYEKGANPEAQIMAAKRHGRVVATGIIALLYAPRDEITLMSTPFYRDLLHGVEFETEQRRLDLLITPLRGNDLPRIVRQGRVDGLIFVSANDEVCQVASKVKLPVAMLSTHSQLLYNLLPDNEQGTYQATKYLLENGHRNIAYLGMESTATALSYNVQAVERYAGYKRALTEFGLVPDANLFYETANCLEKFGARGVQQLLAQTNWRRSHALGFTALVCHNDLVAMGAIHKLQELGLRVPDDLSVVGFDDVSTLYNFQPALTSVTFSRFEMGRRAVTWVCDEFAALTTQPKSPRKEPLGTEHFATNLVVRDSTRALESRPSVNSGEQS